jgi:hypothetical protein
MSIRPPKGEQLDAINPWCPAVQTSFDLIKDDAFVTGQGCNYAHFKAVVSPIGIADRGDYRREGGVDTITDNGMVYFCVGTFSGLEVSNTRNKNRTDGGTVDPSKSFLILPRFYNKTGNSPSNTVDTTPEDTGERIYLCPGDRIYVNDPQANVLVSNYQRMTYEVGPNVPMFPIIKLEVPIIDSRNIQYVEGLDYCIGSTGSINWLPGGSNPGIDPSTGKGRVYSIRYLYKAFHYVESIVNEVRQSNVTEGGVRIPERMAYHAVIVREYLYHTQNRGDPKNVSASTTPNRAVQEPLDSIKGGPGAISVYMVNIVEDGLLDD